MAEQTDYAGFRLRYGGKVGEIEANTFVRSLQGMITTIEEVNNEIASGRKIEIRVRAPEKGSVLLHMSVVAPSLTDLLLPYATLDNLYKLIGVVGTIITIKKTLGAKKAKDVQSNGNEVKITTESGNIINVDARAYNIYSTNQRVNNAIENVFDALESDPKVTDFKMVDEDDKPITEIEREEFSELSHSVEQIDERTELETVPATLNVIRVAFEEKYKWEFYWKGLKINAKILDESFLRKVDSGEPFAKGDSLNVRLRIRKEFDETVNTLVNKGYEVVEVIKHIPRPQQDNLFQP